MHEGTKVAEIRGEITLADGTRSEFSIHKDVGWQQWGAARERLGQTVDVVVTIAQATEEWLDYEEKEEG